MQYCAFDINMLRVITCKYAFKHNREDKTNRYVQNNSMHSKICNESYLAHLIILFRNHAVIYKAFAVSDFTINFVNY